MKDTGERFIHKVKNDEKQEVLHKEKYLLAKAYVKDRRVLDIACGSGYGSFLLSEEANSILGIDISEEAVKYAEENYKSENLYFKQGDATNTNLPSDYFDTIISFETIEHIPNYKKYLSEMKRVLKPNGTFICSTPNKNITSRYSKKPLNQFHVKEFSFKEFKKELSDYFKIIEIYGQRQRKIDFKLKFRLLVQSRIKTFYNRICDLKKKIKKPTRVTIQSQGKLYLIDYFNKKLQPTYLTVICKKD